MNRQLSVFCFILVSFCLGFCDPFGFPVNEIQFHVDPNRISSLRMVVNKKGGSSSSSGGGGYVNRINFESLRGSPLVFINGVKIRSKESAELTYGERADLATLIKMHANKNLKPSLYASLITSISNIKQGTKNWDFRNELKVLSDALPLRSEAYTTQDISMIYVAFARMEVNYDSTLGTNDGFIGTTVKLLPSLAERGVGDVIWSIGTTGGQWKRLSPTLQKALLTSISVHSTDFRYFSMHLILTFSTQITRTS